MPKKPRRVEFIVSFTLPEGARVLDARAYVEDAVASMKGALYSGGFEGPGDPMFNLDGDSVKVRQMRAQRQRSLT